MIKDVKNDIVFTPDYFAEFMCDLAEITCESTVLDNAAGSGQLIIPALKRGASAVAVEYNGEVYRALEENLNTFGNKATSICCDGLNVEEELLKDIDTVLINPPYSFDGAGLIFAYEASKNMKAGKMVVLVPSSAGDKQDWTSKVLENNTLKASIMCADIFKGFASVNVSVYVFECGRPHKADDIVTFIDFTNDGYTRSGRKTQKGKVTNTNKAEERYKEVVDIVLHDKEPELLKDKVIKDTLKETSNWSYSSHVVIDTTPTEEDFKKVVADYLAYKCKMLLQNADNAHTHE